MEPTAEDKAKAVIDTAAEAAKALVESAVVPPWMQDHIIEERGYRERIDAVIPTLATKEELKGLATEKSIREIVHWQRNIVMGAELIRGGGKWGYRALLVVAGIIGALIVILGGWKTLIGYFFTPKI